MADEHDPSQLEKEWLKSPTSSSSETGTIETTVNGDAGFQAILEKGNSSELLLKAWEMKAMDRPSDRDYRSVLHYLEADGGQLYEAEMDYICEEEDLVTLRPGHGSGRGHGWLDVLAETFLLRFRCKPLT
ncbi:MAG: hypothetical protein L6R37_007845, partial [Teloschistes peruensis]